MAPASSCTPPAAAFASRQHRERFVAVNTLSGEHPAHRPQKKKAPEGAFNMLRLVKQAD